MKEIYSQRARCLPSLCLIDGVFHRDSMRLLPKPRSATSGCRVITAGSETRLQQAKNSDQEHFV